ncbi:MAG: hypothetical protein M1829_005672 [Trizodia sp. TS-e1964]|nr:MAG: hypothetical protein M1829_005672 [Trizodia sp. TS-e1964]
MPLPRKSPNNGNPQASRKPTHHPLELVDMSLQLQMLYTPGDDFRIFPEVRCQIQQMETAMQPHHASTSSRSQHLILRSLLVFITSILLFCGAIVTYLLFYRTYIPTISFERVVHLQFGDGNPYGTASIGRSLASQQAYDVSVQLELPRSPSNLAAGNFMLDLTLLSPRPPTPTSPADVLVQARRPAILTYASGFVETASLLAAAPLWLLGWKRERERLTVPMLEGVAFARGWRNVPGSLRLEVQSWGREPLMLYSATVKFRARLGGLSYFMYHHRILAFLLCVPLIWAWLLLCTTLTWLFLSLYFSTPPVIKAESTEIKTEDETDTALDMSDTPRTFPTYSRQPPLSHLGRGAWDVKAEPSLESPGLSTAADDEDDEDNDIVEGLVDLRTRVRRGGLVDSGIGSSLDERGIGAARRRSAQR